MLESPNIHIYLLTINLSLPNFSRLLLQHAQQALPRKYLYNLIIDNRTESVVNRIQYLNLNQSLLPRLDPYPKTLLAPLPTHHNTPTRPQPHHLRQTPPVLGPIKIMIVIIPTNFPTNPPYPSIKPIHKYFRTVVITLIQCGQLVE